ncbi:FtsX-like permease family protein [Psychromonas sp.]|uniref:ABC transporter permease n=1 Tax=Psychromonas sp. TaxID=1884585 RepID=UPI003561EE49
MVYLNPMFSRSVRRVKKWFNLDLLLVLKTQVAEYKSNSLLNIGFIISLAMATSTLLSVLILNHASREQYQQANSWFNNPVQFHIVPDQGNKLTRKDFSTLRKQGFSQITPVLTFTKKLPNGKYIKFTAIDLLPPSIIQPQRFNTQRVLLTGKYLNSLALSSAESNTLDKQILLADGSVFPIALREPEQWQEVALLDITLAWELFPEEGDFSYLAVAPMSEQNTKILRSVLPEHLSLYEPWSADERQGFADALHLNLNALAILAFMVSLFIAFQAANQAWAKRARLAIQLRLLGVRLFTIKIVLLIEAFFLVVCAAILGLFLALGLVYLLLPLLGLTLQQLYSLSSSGNLIWQWSYSLWAFLISSFAVLLALIKQLTLISRKQIRVSSGSQNIDFPVRLSLLATFFLLLLFIIWPGNNWLQLMVKYGLLLAASIVFLPQFLKFLLFSGGYFVNSFRFKYIFKDAGKQILRRYLPLAAFYLALTASIAAALMVNSFETAFVKYLEQELSADIFIRHKPGQKQKIADWLNSQTEVIEVNLLRHTWVKADAASVKLFTVQTPRQLDSLLFKSVSNSAAEGCYINEQIALEKQLKAGQTILLSQADQKYTCKIKGIYYEYGYPGYSVSVEKAELTEIFQGWIDTGFAVFIEPGRTVAKQDILTTLQLDEQQVYLPAQIKKLALDIFAQTFVLIQSIAAVLLLIACIGLFMAANSLELARQSDLFILRSLGYNKIALFNHMLVQWLLLAFGTMLLSWLVAIILADALVTKVLPASFGWSMPLILNITPFAFSSVVALLLLIPALTIPLYKLNIVRLSL